MSVIRHIDITNFVIHILLIHYVGVNNRESEWEKYATIIFISCRKKKFSKFCFLDIYFFQFSPENGRNFYRHCHVLPVYNSQDLVQHKPSLLYVRLLKTASATSMSEFSSTVFLLPINESAISSSDVVFVTIRSLSKRTITTFYLMCCVYSRFAKNVDSGVSFLFVPLKEVFTLIENNLFICYGYRV